MPLAGVTGQLSRGPHGDVGSFVFKQCDDDDDDDDDKDDDGDDDDNGDDDGDEADDGDDDDGDSDSDGDGDGDVDGDDDDEDGGLRPPMAEVPDPDAARLAHRSASPAATVELNVGVGWASAHRGQCRTSRPILPAVAASPTAVAGDSRSK